MDYSHLFHNILHLNFFLFNVPESQNGIHTTICEEAIFLQKSLRKDKDVFISKDSLTTTENGLMNEKRRVTKGRKLKKSARELSCHVIASISKCFHKACYFIVLSLY